MLAGWAICAALGSGLAHAAAPEGAPSTDATSEDSASSGPSVGAIAAGCVGVLFGALLARWQIKALQKRHNR